MYPIRLATLVMSAPLRDFDRATFRCDLVDGVHARARSRLRSSSPWRAECTPSEALQLDAIPWRRRGSGTSSAERHVCHAAGRRRRLDLVVLLEALEPVP